ncbi:MAG: non-heme iron oxygenase ferredoxin subunit [Micrococcaceae bacterium]
MEKACSTTDIKAGEVQHFDIEGTPVAIVHAEDQNFYAIHDVCSHGDIPLSEGFVEGCALECIGHGSQFDLKTGQPLNLPAYEAVKVYETEIKDGEVFVDINAIVNAKEFEA